MWFQVTFTVPAGREKTSPYEVTLPVSAGTIRRVRVQMCPGAHKMVGVQIKFQNQVRWPLYPEDWIELDEWPLDFEDEFEIVPPPSHLAIMAHAEDCNYDHEVTVAVGILRHGLPGVLDKLIELFTTRRS